VHMNDMDEKFVGCLHPTKTSDPHGGLAASCAGNRGAPDGNETRGCLEQDIFRSRAGDRVEG
jgi:hypothetical protein